MSGHLGLRGKYWFVWKTADCDTEKKKRMSCLCWYTRYNFGDNNVDYVKMKNGAA